MNYMTAKEAADLWGISQRRVAILCSEGRIANAEMISNMWLIPKESQKPDDGRSLRYLKEQKIKPFIKWAGGKGQLLDEIRKFYPSGLGEDINKYAEPFVGGGAVLFDVLSNYNIDEVYISDSNAELISAYAALRDNTEELITLLKQYEASYLPMDDAGRKSFYYEKRSRYNELKLSQQRNIELVALFIFLNRTCFNGLYRVNSKGEYNVPMGAYKNPTICDEDNLRRVAKALKGAIIRHADYKESESFIDDHTFVYFDPPYRPLPSSQSFTAYTEEEFNDACQTELGNFIKHLSGSGAYVIASNSDPKNTNPDDNFFDDLYDGMIINRICASRMINSNANARGKISELLICSNGEGKDIMAEKRINKWEPDNFELEMTTVWSFPDRGKWATHDAKWRGNWSPYIPRNIILRYSQEGDLVLDQFAGGGTTLVEAKLLNRDIIGVDVNDAALERCKEKTDFEHEGANGKVCIKKGDARNLSFISDQSIDLICTHPPYADMIKYSKDLGLDIPEDLSNFEIDSFLEEMKKVASESFRVIKKGKFCVVLMGDARRKGHMIPMSFDVMKIFEEAGFKLKELIIKQQHNCRATGYWKTNSVKYNFLLIAHEYLFVFKKP